MTSKVTVQNATSIFPTTENSSHFFTPLLGKSLSLVLGIIFTTEKRPAKGALVCSFVSVFIVRTSSEHQLASQHPCLCVLTTKTECVLTNRFLFTLFVVLVKIDLLNTETSYKRLVSQILKSVYIEVVIKLLKHF